MNENKERGKGLFDETAGKVKQAAGDLTGNEQLHDEGAAQETGGQVRQGVAKGVGQVKGAAEEVGGRLKSAVGGLTGDTSQEVEGHVDTAKGEARENLNR